MVCEINHKLREEDHNRKDVYDRKSIEEWHIKFGNHLSKCNDSDCQKELDNWKKYLPKYVH